MSYDPEQENHKKSKRSDKSGKQIQNLDHLIEFAQNNVKDTVAFVVMVVGIFWMFVNSFWGGIIVGLVAGFYFSREIVYVVKSFNEFIEAQGIARTAILAGTALALFIAAPGILIGAAAMAGLKVLMK